jgi:hypothetical protein
MLTILYNLKIVRLSALFVLSNSEFVEHGYSILFYKHIQVKHFTMVALYGLKNISAATVKKYYTTATSIAILFYKHI